MEGVILARTLNDGASPWPCAPYISLSHPSLESSCYLYYFVYLFLMLEIEPRTSHMLGQPSATELYP
jgi:hypothetical protein